jgi:hypothetical protein
MPSRHWSLQQNNNTHANLHVAVAGLALHKGRAKINDFDQAGALVVVALHQNVFWFQVAVHHTSLLHGTQGIQQLRANPNPEPIFRLAS